MKLKIVFPVVKTYSSEEYALILEDSARKIHYWTEDGLYDGNSEKQENLN